MGATRDVEEEGGVEDKEGRGYEKRGSRGQKIKRGGVTRRGDLTLIRGLYF